MNWKKMAEAFGQAYGRDFKLNKMNKQGLNDESRLLLKGKRSSDDTDARQQFTHGTRIGKYDFNKANDRAIEKADLADKDFYYSSDVEKELDDIVDKRSDAALNKDFEREFDRAVKQHVSEDPNRGKWSEGEVRNQAIDMLKSGADISDVLRFLRGDIDNVNIPD